MLRAVSWGGGLGSLAGRYKRAPMQWKHGLCIAPVKVPASSGPPPANPYSPGRDWAPGWTNALETVPSPEHGTTGVTGRMKCRCPPGTGSRVRPLPSAHAWGKSSYLPRCSLPFNHGAQTLWTFSFKAQYTTRHSKGVSTSSFPSLSQPRSPPCSLCSWKLIRKSPGDFLDEPAKRPGEQPHLTLSNMNLQVTQLLQSRNNPAFNESLT